MAATEDYLNAISRLETAAELVAKLHAQAKAITGGLSNIATKSKLETGDKRWGERAVDAGTPIEEVIDMSGWPTAEELQRSLTEWNVARNAVYSLWRQVPEEHRSRLPRPKTILPFE